MSWERNFLHLASSRKRNSKQEDSVPNSILTLWWPIPAMMIRWNNICIFRIGVYHLFQSAAGMFSCSFQPAFAPFRNCPVRHASISCSQISEKYIISRCQLSDLPVTLLVETTSRASKLFFFVYLYVSARKINCRSSRSSSPTNTRVQ